MKITAAVRVASAASLALAISVLLPTDTVDAQGRTQKISKNLVKKAEDMVKELEKARKQVEKTAKKYDEMFSKKKVKDRQKAYKNLESEVKKTEDRVKDVRKRVESMQKEADKFFSEWSKGLAKVEGADLRAKSQSNMTESRDRYGAVIESGLKAGGLYDGFVTDVKHQMSYFQLDMSDAAMAKLGPNRSETQQKARGLFRSVDELTRTTKSYVDSMK
jgi:vacuolar-type H+-ATPase subunit I/STV1